MRSRATVLVLCLMVVLAALLFSAASQARPGAMSGNANGFSFRSNLVPVSNPNYPQINPQASQTLIVNDAHASKAVRRLLQETTRFSDYRVSAYCVSKIPFQTSSGGVLAGVDDGFSGPWGNKASHTFTPRAFDNIPQIDHQVAKLAVGNYCSIYTESWNGLTFYKLLAIARMS